MEADLSAWAERLSVAARQAEQERWARQRAAGLECCQCPVPAVPRAELDQAAAEAALRQEVRSRLAEVYPGLGPGLRALLADQVAAGLLRPGPLVVLTGL